jgi:hypothetical protein
VAKDGHGIELRCQASRYRGGKSGSREDDGDAREVNAKVERLKHEDVSGEKTYDAKSEQSADNKSDTGEFYGL